MNEYIKVDRRWLLVDYLSVAPKEREKKRDQDEEEEKSQSARYFEMIADVQCAQVAVR